jgi:hypothetical protein
MRSERNHPSFMLISLGLAIFAAQLLTASIVYLPLVFMLMTLDKK